MDLSAVGLWRVSWSAFIVALACGLLWLHAYICYATSLYRSANGGEGGWAGFWASYLSTVGLLLSAPGLLRDVPMVAHSDPPVERARRRMVWCQRIWLAALSIAMILVVEVMAIVLLGS